MKIKEFEALNLKDCLQQVRQEMGPEAVILETRKCRTGGVMGWGTREAVRIVAATGVSVQNPPRAGRQPADNSRQPAAGEEQPESGERRAVSSERQAASAEQRVSSGKRQPIIAERPAVGPGAAIGRPITRLPDNSISGSEAKLQQLQKELEELRSGMAAIRQAVVTAPVAATTLAPLPAASAGPEALHPELARKLRSAEVSEDLVADMLKGLPDMSGWKSQARAPMAESAMRDAMAQRIHCTGPIDLPKGQTRVVALIGPTGVGKTTTIAKLAANYALVEKKKVGLVTLDTYRIAAVEQLKTYGQIIDIPIRVAYTPAEVGPAIESFAGFDVILVDTAGRSQKNPMQVSELKNLIEAANCETHLVLAASTKQRDLLDQVERFRHASVDRLLFTKLDETTTYGTIFSVAAKTGLPVSYLTTGQKVPEDIEAAEAARLVTLVMNSAAPSS
jgi:flagellar biosynthesis protein FlhF